MCQIGCRYWVIVHWASFLAPLLPSHPLTPHFRRTLPSTPFLRFTPSRVRFVRDPCQPSVLFNSILRTFPLRLQCPSFFTSSPTLPRSSSLRSRTRFRTLRTGDASLSSVAGQRQKFVLPCLCPTSLSQVPGNHFRLSRWAREISSEGG